MNKILDKQEVKEFVEKYKVECYTIIVKVDNRKKKASYIIDGKKKIPANYEEVLKYFD